VSKYPADTEVPSFRSRGLRQVRRPGEHDLGAADEKDAVQQAIERFEVPAALQNRLTVASNGRSPEETNRPGAQISA
jgi:hypothetical protein